MRHDCEEILRAKLKGENYAKLTRLDNPELYRFLADATELCNPDSAFICTDAEEDAQYVRQQAIELGEETPLRIEGHTVHFDGIHDQGRDREATKYLVPRTDSLSDALNQVEREEGLAEVRGLLKDSMQGRTMIVRFLSLGPVGSVFSIP